MEAQSIFNQIITNLLEFVENIFRENIHTIYVNTSFVWYKDFLNSLFSHFYNEFYRWNDIIEDLLLDLYAANGLSLILRYDSKNLVDAITRL